MKEKKRRSVKKDVKKFIGWSELGRLIKQFSGLKKRRNQQLFATTFLTGGRISEVLELKSENFSFKKDRIIVTDMPLKKSYNKLGEYFEELSEEEYQEVAPTLKRLYMYNDEKDVYRRKRYETEPDEDAVRRKFSFRVDEPFAGLVIEAVETSEGYLFPSPKKEDLPITRQQSYNIMRSIGEDITDGKGLYNHWFRAQRASCLTSFYGMRQERMMEWMTWEHEQTARRYGKMGEVKLSNIMKDKQEDIPDEIKKEWG